MKLDPTQVFLQAEAGLARFKADPIANFRFSSAAQRRFVEAFAKFREVYLRAGNQSGKAQPVDELVATPSGWRTIGSIVPGEEVLACDGTPTRVLGVFPQGELPIFRVEFDDGSSTRCTADHRWVLREHKHRFHGVPGYSVMELKDIVRRWGPKPRAPYAVEIPTTDPVEYGEESLPIPPYTFGALLGDGCFGKNSISMSGADDEVLDRIRAELPGMFVTSTAEDTYDYSITASRGRNMSVQSRPKNRVLDAVRELGLGALHAHEKFIPRKYLRGSSAQRLDLLRGLMDTDGWADKKGSSYFTTTSPFLRDGVMELVRSLGGRASVGKPKRPWFTYKGERKRGREAWTVLVRLPGVATFGLARKQARVRDSHRTHHRILREVVPCGTEQCVCLFVEHPSHAYLTKDYIVTHNTRVAATFFVAIMRGLTSLDGAVLPLLGAPNVGVALAQGREQAKESMISAVKLAIGDHPHHFEQAGGAIQAVWVKPDKSRSDDWRDWSCMKFFVEDGQSVAGMRLDWCWADEPPKWEMWRELRMRGKANRLFLRAITATPIDILRWRPLRDDFKGCSWPAGKDGKVEIRLSVYDNKALSKEHLRQVEEDSQGPYQDAVLMGEYVNAAGANPFDKEGLKRWTARCTPGVVRTGSCPSGHPFRFETWGEVENGEGYFVVADPSAGIEDREHKHDPSGYVVVSRSLPYTVVERYNGYLDPTDLGWLSAQRATHWNKAMLAWEHNSGYGEAFWKGSGQYSNPYVQFQSDRRNLKLSERIGWLTTASTRGTIIGALQKAIKQDGLMVYSLEAVESLGSVVLKRDGLRPEAGAGAHDEDMIILGLACHLLETLPFYRRREPGSTTLMRDLGVRPRQVGVAQNDPFANPW